MNTPQMHKSGYHWLMSSGAQFNIICNSSPLINLASSSSPCQWRRRKDKQTKKTKIIKKRIIQASGDKQVQLFLVYTRVFRRLCATRLTSSLAEGQFNIHSNIYIRL